VRAGDVLVRIAPRDYEVARAEDRPSTRTGTFRDFPAFPSTVLGNTRPVMVLLPPSYDREPDRRYPVLYAQDAQNLFDERGSFIGQEWRLDETLTRLWSENRLPEIIVVGVGNTGVTRMREYMPGETGDRYIRFLTTELKPFIDNRFRTKRGPKDTALMGSSMGAIISIWGIVTRPEVFGQAAGLSVSLQFAEPIRNRLAYGARPNVRAYIDIGTAEGAHPLSESSQQTFLDAFREATDGLRMLGYREGRDFVAREIEGAEHNERAWAARLDEPLIFLFAPRPTSAAG
jgi:enterochelin esterase-like enzyme